MSCYRGKCQVESEGSVRQSGLNGIPTFLQHYKKIMAHSNACVNFIQVYKFQCSMKLILAVGPFVHGVARTRSLHARRDKFHDAIVAYNLLETRFPKVDVLFSILQLATNS